MLARPRHPRAAQEPCWHDAGHASPIVSGRLPNAYLKCPRGQVPAEEVCPAAEGKGIAGHLESTLINVSFKTFSCQWQRTRFLVKIW